MKAINTSIVLIMLSLVTINACNPVVNAGEEAELSGVSNLGINQELLVLSNTANEIVSNFMMLSLEDQFMWVQQAESLLDGTALNRPRSGTAYREFPDAFLEGYSVDGLLTKQPAFDELLTHVMPSISIDKLISTAQSILEKRPDFVDMDEEELWIILTAEIEVIYKHKTFRRMTSEHSQLIMSECEGLCGAVAMSVVSGVVIGYVRSMIACSATGPGYGLCAGLATTYKTARLVSAGIALYACVNKCDS